MSAVPILNAWGESWAAAMLGGLLDSTALLAALAGLWWLVRRRASAQLGHGLFLLVLLKLLLPVPVPVPGWMGWLSPHQAVARLADRLATAPAAVPGEGAPPVAPPPPELAAPARPAPAESPAVPLAHQAGTGAPEPAAAPAPSLSVAALLMLAWAAVVATGLVWFARAQVRAARLLRQDLAPPPPVPPAELEELRRRAGVRRPVRVLVTPRVASPAVWGLVRPSVLLPAGLAEELSPGQLRWVLLHELAHIRRGDLWVALLQRVLQIVYFFNPAVWVANRLIDQQREYACDDAALAAAGLPCRECGAVFLALVARADAAPAPSAAGMGLFRYKALVRRRLLRLLDGRRPVRERLSLGAAGLLVLVAAAVLPSLEAGDGNPPPGAGRRDKPPTASAEEADAPLVYSGRVLDADGKPLAGAKVFLVESTARGFHHGERASSGRDGGFRFTVARAEFDRSRERVPWEHVLVAATAKGYGPDWQNANRPALAADLTFHLPADDVPVRGRVIDLEGRPVKGATVSCGTVSCQSDRQGKPIPFDARDEAGGGGAVMPLDELVSAATTDDDGRFTLTGVGRDRLLDIAIGGPTIEHRSAEVMTRQGPTKTLPGTGLVLPGNEPTKIRYGATFVHVAAPTKPILGVVRDEDTGEPVAGVEVYKPFVRSNEATAAATTDARGRYRLVGLPKADVYQLKVMPAADQPYFSQDVTVRATTPGLEPVTADVMLKRRLMIRGRLTDRVTGKPVRAWVQYRPLNGNPHRPRAAGDVRTAAEAGDDGTFSLPALAGKGVVFVRAGNGPDNRYLPARLDPADRARGLLDKRDPLLLDTAPLPVLLSEYNAYRLVEPPEGARSFPCDLALDPGKSLSGKVVDPQGKPLAGVEVYSLNNPDVAGHGRELDGADFTAFALDPERPRRLFFYHKERDLGGSLVVRGDEAAAVTARLEPCGTVSGRLLDAAGKPVAGASFEVIYDDAGGTPHVYFPGGFQVATEEEARRQERANGFSGKTLLTRADTTDRDGRFRLGQILPGVRFDLRAHVSVPAPDIAPNASREVGSRVVARPTLRPGERRDLGELRIDLSLAEAKPGR